MGHVLSDETVKRIFQRPCKFSVLSRPSAIINLRLREQKKRQNRFFCRKEGCGWGPSSTSSRAKHEQKKHPELFSGPIHTQDGGQPATGPGQSGLRSGLFVFARDGGGNQYEGTLGLVSRNQLSPLVTNYISDQAEEGSGSVSLTGSEPMHSSVSGE